MTRMTGPDCAVMCNLINKYTFIHTYIHIYTYIHAYAIVCMYVCIFIKLDITAQFGPVILVILCHSH